jgi:hypothetical protein
MNMYYYSDFSSNETILLPSSSTIYCTGTYVISSRASDDLAIVGQNTKKGRKEQGSVKSKLAQRETHIYCSRINSAEARYERDI